MNKVEWINCYKQVVKFENGEFNSGSEIRDYIIFINKTVSASNLFFNVCMSCPGSIRKAHNDFQVYLNRWADENNPELLPAAPELKGAYSTDFWTSQLRLSNFELLTKLVAKIRTDLAKAIQVKSGVVDDFTHNYEAIREYIKVKRALGELEVVEPIVEEEVVEDTTIPAVSIKPKKRKRNGKSEIEDAGVLAGGIDGDYRGLSEDSDSRVSENVEEWDGE